MTYLPRSIDRHLDFFTEFAAAVCVDGARATGKTETCSRRADFSYFLDSPSDRAPLEADIDLTSLPEGTILLDEWQNLPQVWNSVRRRVDSGEKPGRFLITGSASPLPDNGTHTGAGRIYSVHMRPMGLHERIFETPTVALRQLQQGGAQISGSTGKTIGDYCQEIAGSGFPALIEAPWEWRMEFLDSYLTRIVDRDLPSLGESLRSPETFHRWMRAYAAATSTTTSYSKIINSTSGSDGAQLSRETNRRFRDLLQRIWVLDPLPAWHSGRNPLKEVTQTPKHHLVDPALAMRLLDLQGRDLLTPRGSHMLGPMFEALATLTVRAAATATGSKVRHLRTHGGRNEVDLVVTDKEGYHVGLEVKSANFVEDKDVTQLLWFKNEVGEDVRDVVVIYSGAHAYRRQDGVACIPLGLLGE
ncbi:ATPase AAA [Corynebacterium phocae]|uniref:ATPase AAA n=1 Tax=Corynebacterium phocae TaxID=161895 RepID=A0A1L7D0P6_9CORY|nr:DUF4143 domain-containing protein [Corynebacterium phocae]APT91660.1 ATPase AAA [Corynebacterium phocae]KAA8728633.1 ATP-binding protein [Corynebacterium phocae]